MKNTSALLVIAGLSCAAFGPTYTDVNQIPTDIPHFQDPAPPNVFVGGDPRIKQTDSIEVQALKVAASKTYGDAKEYYDYQEKWRPGAMAQDIEYLNYLDTHPETGSQFKGGFWGIALEELLSRRAIAAKTS